MGWRKMQEIIGQYSTIFNSSLSVTHCYRGEKCFGDSEILHEIARDTKRIISCSFDFRVVARTFSESPLHFISFLTVSDPLSLTRLHTLSLSPHTL